MSEELSQGMLSFAEAAEYRPWKADYPCLRGVCLRSQAKLRDPEPSSSKSLHLRTEPRPGKNSATVSPNHGSQNTAPLGFFCGPVDWTFQGPATHLISITLITEACKSDQSFKKMCSEVYLGFD